MTKKTPKTQTNHKPTPKTKKQTEKMKERKMKENNFQNYSVIMTFIWV